MTPLSDKTQDKIMNEISSILISSSRPLTSFEIQDQIDLNYRKIVYEKDVVSFKRTRAFLLEMYKLGKIKKAVDKKNCLTKWEWVK